MISEEKIIIGQAGIGYWGPNLLRNFNRLENCVVKSCCDLNEAAFAEIKKNYPQISLTADYADLLNDKEIQAIVIAVPAPLHYIFARKALAAGKHVLVEKPLTLNIAEAVKLIELAAEVKKKIMVGHLLLYHPAINKLKELISTGELGKIHYIYTQRLNLGKIRSQENVLWSLAPHDISVILHLIDSQPVGVSSAGGAYIQKGIEDVVFFSIFFGGGEIGSVHVSWLDPAKTRKLVVVGSKKMAVFEDGAAQTPLILFDKGVDFGTDLNHPEQVIKLRAGPPTNIEIGGAEPLTLECEHFINCIKYDREPLSNGQNGLAVLKVLEAVQKALNKKESDELL